MLTSESLQKIEDLAEQVATHEGCKLYDIEFSGGAGGRILRVYIDKNQEGGPNVDDCSNVSRGLNLLLDEHDPIPEGKYMLEVSTPGVERPLKKRWHYEAVAGKKVWIRLSRALGLLATVDKKHASLKQLSEVVVNCSDEGVQLSIENEVVMVPYSAIEKAHLVFEFDADKGKKKSSK